MSNVTSTFRPGPSGDNSGDEKFFDIEDLTTPGTEQTLLTAIVPSGKNYNLLQVTLVCRQEGAFKLYLDSDLIASGRTGSAQSNVIFPFKPFRIAGEGKTIELKFTGLPNKPSVDIEAFVQAREITI